jgi:hypothetical protein
MPFRILYLIKIIYGSKKAFGIIPPSPTMSLSATKLF